MDSGLSSSRGCAAAADKYYDSKTEPISSFFNPTHEPTFLDPPSSSYLPPLNPTNPNPVYNPVWSGNIRPDHPTFTGLVATDRNNDVSLNSQPPVLSSNANMGRGSNHQQVLQSTKNPKKRARASKRPPTTVLTTDTSNFRQMVQEFTGIPTAPFSSYSTRLDRISGRGLGPWYRVPPVPPKIRLQQQALTTLNPQNPKFLFQESDHVRRSDVLCGFAGSSTDWKGENENLLPKQDGYEVNTSNDDHIIYKGFESVISLGDDGDQAQGNIDSWLMPF